MNIQVGANTGKNNKQERDYGKGEEKARWDKEGGGEDSGMKKWKYWGKGVYVQGGDVEQSMGESTNGEKSYETWYTISCFNQPIN